MVFALILSLFLNAYLLIRFGSFLSQRFKDGAGERIAQRWMWLILHCRARKIPGMAEALRIGAQSQQCFYGHIQHNDWRRMIESPRDDDRNPHVILQNRVLPVKDYLEEGGDQKVLGTMLVSCSITTISYF